MTITLAPLELDAHFLLNPEVDAIGDVTPTIETEGGHPDWNRRHCQPDVLCLVVERNLKADDEMRRRQSVSQ